MKAHWLYYLVKVLSWIGLKLFFGGVELTGRERIPKEGGVILAPNHQGAFMDALLSGTYIERPVHFLTRADVFKKRFIPFLKSLNMMPIYRIRDGFQTLSQNEQVFQQCFQKLSDEQTILIFPEGNHGIEHYLRPLSKGTARLALDARAAIDPATKIYVIPVGINYFSHYRPLAKVKIHFGEPLLLDDYMALYAEHKQKAYNAFKEDLREGMRKTLILPDDSENYPQKQDFIFQPRHERLPFEKLKELGEQAPGIRSVKKPDWITKILIAFFSILNAPALLGLWQLLRGIKDKVFYVSLKFLVGGILHLIWWWVLFAIGTVWIGWEAGALFALTGVLMMYARQELIGY